MSRFTLAGSGKRLNRSRASTIASARQSRRRRVPDRERRDPVGVDVLGRLEQLAERADGVPGRGVGRTADLQQDGAIALDDQGEVGSVGHSLQSPIFRGWGPQGPSSPKRWRQAVERRRGRGAGQAIPTALAALSTLPRPGGRRCGLVPAGQRPRSGARAPRSASWSRPFEATTWPPEEPVLAAPLVGHPAPGGPDQGRAGRDVPGARGAAPRSRRAARRPRRPGRGRPPPCAAAPATRIPRATRLSKFVVLEAVAVVGEAGGEDRVLEHGRDAHGDGPVVLEGPAARRAPEGLAERRARGPRRACGTPSST